MQRTAIRRFMLGALLALVLTIGPSVRMVWAQEVDDGEIWITLLDGSVCRLSDWYCISSEEPVIIWEEPQD